MKTVMILGGSASEVPVIQRACEFGHRVIVVDRENNVPGFEVNGIIPIRHSIADKDKLLEIAIEYKVDGIVPSVDAGVRSAAYITKVLGLPGISENAAIMGTDKVEMRKRLKERNIPIPMFFIVSTEEEYLKAILQFKDKCVVKAADSSGSRGVYLLNDLSNHNDILYAYNYCRKFSSTGELLIEEFMEGLEICVETLNFGGECYPIQITDQMHKQPPFFTDCGYSQPSILNDEIKNRIKEIARDANLAIENFQGSSCTEMIVTSEGPKIVEIGARLAGDFMTTKMVPLSTGVDMPGAVVNIALGEIPNIEPTHTKASCVRYYMKERVGIIRDIVGVESALKVEGITDVGILKGIGEEATLLRKSSDRLGYVISQADTADEAIERAEMALNMIDFIVEDK